MPDKNLPVVLAKEITETDVAASAVPTPIWYSAIPDILEININPIVDPQLQEYIRKIYVDVPGIEDGYVIMNTGYIANSFKDGGE